MAYYNGSVYRGTGDTLLCDECADGVVPFDTKEDRFGVYRVQKDPWRWHAIFGDVCSKCNKQC